MRHPPVVTAPRICASKLMGADDTVVPTPSPGLSELKLLLEPGGAAGLAAALKYPQIVRGKTTVVLATGGNMDLSTVAACLQRADRSPHGASLLAPLSA